MTSPLSLARPVKSLRFGPGLRSRPLVSGIPDNFENGEKTPFSKILFFGYVWMDPKTYCFFDVLIAVAVV